MDSAWIRKIFFFQQMLCFPEELHTMCERSLSPIAAAIQQVPCVIIYYFLKLSYSQQYLSVLTAASTLLIPDCSGLKNNLKQKEDTN